MGNKKEAKNTAGKAPEKQAQKENIKPDDNKPKAGKKKGMSVDQKAAVIKNVYFKMVS